jgi:hypothetical protein
MDEGLESKLRFYVHQELARLKELLISLKASATPDV